MRRRRKQGCVVAAPISVPDRGKTPPVGVGGPQGSPFAPPPQPPSGTLGSGCPGSLGRGPCFRALGGKAGGGERHPGTCVCGECACTRTRPPGTQARDPSVGVFLRALPRRQSNCPGRGACLGSSVESSTRCSGLRRFPFFSSSTGPIATGSRRRRLVLKPSQKDALQALFQQNPYPGIATRERLARELGIDESRVQVGPPPLHPFSLSRLSMPIQGS